MKHSWESILSWCIYTYIYILRMILCKCPTDIFSAAETVCLHISTITSHLKQVLYSFQWKGAKVLSKGGARICVAVSPDYERGHNCCQNRCMALVTTDLSHSRELSVVSVTVILADSSDLDIGSHFSSVFSKTTPADPCKMVFLHDSSLIRHLSDVCSIWSMFVS